MEQNENKQEIKSDILKEVINNVAAAKLGTKHEIIIREGEAKKLYDPEPYNAEGTIDTPARWVESKLDFRFEGETEDIDKDYNRSVQDYQNSCVVEIDREALRIRLIENHDNHFCRVVVGDLRVSNDFKDFGINEGKNYTAIELAKYIKMHRSCFAEKSVANTLVNQLMGIKYNVSKELERIENNRGDRRMLVSQVVKTNVPQSFQLYIPVFKGQSKVSFNVELYIDPDDLSCQLVSPDAKDLIDESANSIIDSVVDRIKAAAPYITIIEI